MKKTSIFVAARKFLALLDRPSRPRRTPSRGADQPNTAKSSETFRSSPADRSLPIPNIMVVDPLEGLDLKPYYASIADDVGDISRAMMEALWRLEANGRADAYWFLRTMQHHWEMHLRELSLYLHARRFSVHTSRVATVAMESCGDVDGPSDVGSNAV